MSNTGGKQFYSALQKKAQAALGSTFKSQILPIQYPAQGDFMYNYLNANQIFNLETFNYISANVSPGDVDGTAKLSAAGGFPNAYSQLLSLIEYSLSSADSAKLQKAQSNATAQEGTIVSDYQNTFGTITTAQMTAARVSTKVDYVISYVLGSQWSGATPPLTWTAMSQARNLASLLPKMPASGNQVVTDVTVYLNMLQPVLALQDALSNGAWILRSLKNNTNTPTAANGGMQTFDPSTGAVNTKLQDAFGISSSVQSINNDLQNTHRTIDLSMSTSSASGGNMSVSVEGQAGFSIGDVLTFSTSAHGSYNMNKASGTSQDCSVSISYKGYSMIPIQPLAWQQATNQGWFEGSVISQAVANDGKDVSGFKFASAPPFKLDKISNGGDFGVLNNILIANYPDITITYNKADFSSFKQSWDTRVTGNVTLFGFIKLGSFSSGVYKSSYAQGSDNSSFTVTFSASPQVISVPQNQKTAYVIGGAINNVV